MNKPMRVLGIETSCDDTGVALYDEQKGLLVHTVYSQTEIHNKYGGVVPELASRDHTRKLIPLLKQSLSEANIASDTITGIAYTSGPGLAGSLFTGATTAKTLGLIWNIPTLGIHHLEGHLLAPMLEAKSLRPPFIALLVSGGHTLLTEVKQLGEYKILGETQDDAAGEAFDKTAKLLGLGYPGGAELSALAEKGTPGIYTFPRPMLQKDNLDFSFSGLKSHAIRTWQESKQNDQARKDIAHAFVESVSEVITEKCRRALEKTQIPTLIIAGGVSANKQIRASLDKMVKAHDAKLYCPSPSLCTDNGAMIAFTGYKRIKAGFTDNNTEIFIKPRWPLSELEKLYTKEIST